MYLHHTYPSDNIDTLFSVHIFLVSGIIELLKLNSVSTLVFFYDIFILQPKGYLAICIPSPPLSLLNSLTPFIAACNGIINRLTSHSLLTTHHHTLLILEDRNKKKDRLLACFSCCCCCCCHPRIRCVSCQKCYVYIYLQIDRQIRYVHTFV